MLGSVHSNFLCGLAAAAFYKVRGCNVASVLSSCQDALCYGVLLWQASALEHQTHGGPQRVTARLVDAAGAPASVGLLQVQSGDGAFGTVCGMNMEAVDVVCRQLGSA